MNIETLRSWSQALMWVTITLPVLAALSAGGRYYVDRRIQELTSTQTRQETAAMRGELEGARAKVEELEDRTRPREITGTQSAAISEQLRGRPARQVEMTVLVNDPEAERYSAELARAFEAGGWQVNTHRGMFMPAFHGVMVAIPDDRVPVEHPAAVMVMALRAAGIEPLLLKHETPDGQVEVRVSSK